MKTEFKTKFLQYLTQRKESEKGFTLIELLVVIIIIGILSAIALPSFLNQANKAKESEAKQYVGSMNRAQQAKFAEDGNFKTGVDDLGLGIRTQTTNYTYVISGATTGPITSQGVPIVAALRAYTGNAFTLLNTTTSETSTSAILCVSKQPTTAALAETGTTACTVGDEVKK